MRLDSLLHALCLIKTRSQAGRACSEGRVFVNGNAARASKEIRAGDRILWRDPLNRTEREVEIVEVPQGHVSRADARAFYRDISSRAVEDPWVRP